MRRWCALVLFSIAGVVVAGCATYRDELVRSQGAFDQQRNEEALALLRDLERNESSLSKAEQAEYAYLRGMTDERLGYRTDARHWLAVAKAYEDASPGTLPRDWKARMGETLDAMNGAVYDGGGTQALAKAKPDGDAPEASSPPNAKAAAP